MISAILENVIFLISSNVSPTKMYRNAIIPAGEMKYDVLEGSLGVSVCARGYRRQPEVRLMLANILHMKPNFFFSPFRILSCVWSIFLTIVSILGKQISVSKRTLTLTFS